MTRVILDRELHLAFETTRIGVVTTIREGQSTLRTAPQPWDELELPFDDGSVARVVCRNGLQLLPDRARALREMHRILVRGGEVDVEVPGPIDRNPPFAELADALERAEDHHRAASVRWLFSMPEPDDLRGALADAGFEGIRIEAEQNRRAGRSLFAIETNRGRAVRV